jgi:hypothetical protein
MVEADPLEDAVEHTREDLRDEVADHEDHQERDELRYEVRDGRQGVLDAGTDVDRRCRGSGG